MIDDPLRLPRQRLEHAEPALVAGWDELDERVEDRERLAVGAALLGLSDRIAKYGDGLVVPDLRRAGEVCGGFAEPARG
jgi:hypothetical protein